MIKFAALATVAALAIAAPASASEIRLPIAGKTVAQLDTEIVAAARTVCKRDIAASVIYRSAYKSCLRASVADAKAQLRQLAQAPGMQVASN